MNLPTGAASSTNRDFASFHQGGWASASATKPISETAFAAEKKIISARSSNSSLSAFHISDLKIWKRKNKFGFLFVGCNEQSTAQNASRCMIFVHPVSFLTRITAQALAADFNRVAGYARILQQVRLLPVTNGKAIERVGPDRLVPLMASVAFAEALFDASAVGLAFDAMPLTASVEDLPRLKIFDGTEGPVTLGSFITFLIHENHRFEIEVDFIRYRAQGRDREFAARVWINNNGVDFGAQRPPFCARETTERVSKDAFKSLRKMFRHGEAEYARIAAEREAAQ